MAIGTTKALSSSRNTGTGFDSLRTKVSLSGAVISATDASVTRARPMRL